MLHCRIIFFVLLLTCFQQNSYNSAAYGQETDRAVSCSDVYGITNETKQCEFVNTPGRCDTDDGLANYISGLYCTFQGQLRPLGFVLYVLWFLYLLLATAVTSDRFFAPNLPVISAALHLSENVAGETLMALGNGAPDFFTSLVAALSMKDGDAGILYGTLLGSGTFVTTVVIATVIVIRPFRTMGRPLLKDIVFYMCAVFCAFATLWDGKIYVWEASIFLAIYVTYVVVVFVGHVLNKSMMSASSNVEQNAAAPAVISTISGSTSNTNPKNKVAVVIESVHDDDNRQVVAEIINQQQQQQKTPQSVPSDNLTTTNEEQRRQTKNSSLKPAFRQRLAVSINVAWVIATNRRCNDQPIKPAGRSHSLAVTRTSTDSTLVGRPRISFPSLLSKVELGGTRTTRIAIRQASRRSSQSSRCSTAALTPVLLSCQTSVLPAKLATVLDNEHGIAPQPPADEILPGDKEASVHQEKEEEVVVDKTLIKWILDGVNPIEIDDWETQNWFGRAMQVIRAPIVFLMLITNPVLDEEKQLLNWNRPLNSLHCITSPVFAVVAIMEYNVMIGNKFPLVVLIAIAGCIGAGATFFTSENTTRPRYHFVFAVLGFVTTVIWIYVLAGEIVNLLQCFGIALSISRSILGLTCLAWGNSLGDFINNTIIAKQGYSKMAISSCFGGMLFNLLLGLGVPLLIVSIKNGGVVHIVQSNVLTVLFGFLGLELASSFVAIPLIQHFYVRRPYAFYLYSIYAGCIICAVLTECRVISPNIFQYAYAYS